MSTTETFTRHLPTTRRNRVLLGLGATAGVGALAVGGFFAMTNTVSLSVDGETSTLYTTADDVAGLLERQDLETSARDLVVPGPSSELSDGSEVAVAFARPIDLTVDGEAQETWTTALSVDALLDELGVRAGAETSVSRSAGISREGLSLEVRTPKDVTIVVTAKQTTETPVTTTAVTVDEALSEAGIEAPEGSQVAPEGSERITDGSVIALNQVWTETITRDASVPFETRSVEDSSLYSDESTVEVAGAAGQAVETVTIAYLGGDETGREVTSREVTTEPTTKVVRKGTKQRPAAPAAPAAPAVSAGA